MFEFTFMQHAFLGCFLVSLLAGTIGWFLLLRRQTFAAHALPHIGFSGAAASILLHIPSLLGMVLSSMLGGFFMGDGRTYAPSQRDTTTGLILATSLGIGAWCLHKANSASNQATTLLFGDVLSLDIQTLFALAGLTLFCLLCLAFMWRPLLFASLSPDLAQAQGVASSMINRLFLLIAALASSACAEIAGALLSFSLMIGPAAVALKLELSPLKGLLLSIIGSLCLYWGGLILSWYSDAPLAFWISLGGMGLYMTACFLKRHAAKNST